VIALIIAIGVPNAFATDQSSSSVGISNQENEGLEHAIIIGLGGATEMELRGGSLHAGINALRRARFRPDVLADAARRTMA